ncbi:MAG TPA: prealbumin-like fold domain-containing protein [Thermomicrobiales bacterium]|nr:prealbumin-like fold domain-containing protein [Thermomicrobiales bacterium]
MPSSRLPRLQSLVVLLTFLGLLLAPVAGSSSLARQDDPAGESQGDVMATELPGEVTQEPVPPTQLPTEIPPAEPAATEPTATETEEPSAATELPVEDPAPSGTAVDDPPPNDMPGIASAGTTVVMVSGACDLVTRTWPADATSLAALQAACDEYVIDNTFTYTYLDTGATQTQATTGGTTSFAVDPGSFRVESTNPPGMRGAAVGCESASGYSYVRPMFRGFPPNDHGFSSHIDLGDTLTCYWYNLPLQPTIINLVKGECDVAGFDPYTASTDELAKGCTQYQGDATFTYMELYTGDPASELEITQTTVASQTSFTVPPGNFGIKEDIPAGYGDPVVSCLIERMGVHVIFPAPGGLIGGHIDSEGIFTCHWYNVPLGPDTEVPATGSITVVKYSCGPVTGWSLLPCPILKTGQAFDLLFLTDTDWQPVTTGVTGRDGRLTWTDLPPGTYQIDELGRDWCRIESKNLDPGGKGITVNPGEDAVVHVYNCDKRSTPKPIPFPIPPPLIPGPREW